MAVLRYAYHLKEGFVDEPHDVWSVWGKAKGEVMLGSRWRVAFDKLNLM